MASSRRKQIRAQKFAKSPAPVAETVAEDIDGVLVEVIDRKYDGAGQSYEEANWAKLSPAFRLAHNRLRKMRGLSPIPEPKIDLYVPKRAPPPLPFDATSAEAMAVARQFMGGGMMGPAEGEGFRGPTKVTKII